MFRPMTMLLELQRDRDQQRERLRRETREKLERALQKVFPGQAVFVFAVHGMLEDRIGRPVDLLLLPEHRLKDKYNERANCRSFS